MELLMSGHNVKCTELIARRMNEDENNQQDLCGVI